MSCEIDDLVLLKIFKYLNLKTLYKCRIVSKTWCHLVNEIISQRSHLLETFLFSAKFTQPPFLLTKSEFANGINSELGKALAEPSLLVCLLTKRLQLKCVLDDQPEEPSPKSPDTRSTRLSAKRQRTGSGRNQTTLFALDQLRTLLPSNSRNLYIFTSGVIGTDHSQSRTLEIEALNKRELGIVSFFLPRCEPKYRVTLTPIVCDKNFNMIKSELADLNDYFGVREHEKLKFSLLFVNKSCKIKLEKFFDSINQIRQAIGFNQLDDNNNNNFGFTGGYVDSIAVNSASTDFNMAFISFIVDKSFCPHFRVAQVVIPCVERDQFESTIHKKLSMLKETGICDDQQQSSVQLFGIQICCIGKGKEYHEQENLESSIFKRHFPRVPLVGIFGYGEAGMDYLPNYRNNIQDPPPGMSQENEVKWHFYCTVFTIIAIKP